MPGVFRFEPSPVSGPPYFELVGSDGNRRWSSKEKLFRVTNVLQGSVSFGNRLTPINTVTTTTLGTCNVNSTHVHGYVKLASITLQPGALSPFPTTGDWFYVSGSYLGMAGGGNSDSVCVYTFTASGGVVRLEEQLAIYEIRNQVGQTFPYPPFTLDYELWIGTFI